MFLPIALPATSAQRLVIAGSQLYHFTRRDLLNQVLTDGARGAEQCGRHSIQLQAFQGWSLRPFRILRDYSVLDAAVTDPTDWGRYLYFFLGEPGWWAVKKNIGVFAKTNPVAEGYASIRIDGSALLDPQRTHVFYRPDDKVVVVRGDYQGPAWIEL